MKKIILCITMLLITLGVSAHGIDVSTMMLVQNEDGMWTLQVRSALDAFRKEIKTNFSESPYTTPEEFQQQLLEHFKNTLKIRVNDNQDIVLSNGMVSLGHETTVFFDQIELPKNISSIKIIGRMFKDIHMNKTKVLVLKNGFDKKQYVLNKNNDFTLYLIADDNSFIINPKEDSSFTYSFILFPIVIIIGVVLFFLIRQNKSLKIKE